MIQISGDFQRQGRREWPFRFKKGRGASCFVWGWGEGVSRSEHRGIVTRRITAFGTDASATNATQARWPRTTSPRFDPTPRNNRHGMYERGNLRRAPATGVTVSRDYSSIGIHEAPEGLFRGGNPRERDADGAGSTLGPRQTLPLNRAHVDRHRHRGLGSAGPAGGTTRRLHRLGALHPFPR